MKSAKFPLRSGWTPILLAGGMCLAAACALADTPAPAPSQPAVSNTLPQDHECQQQLRAFMATLTEKDFTHGVTGTLDERAPCDQYPDYLYRNYLYTLMRQPLVGSKDSVPAVQARPDCFLLSNIERTNAIYLPPVWPETLTSFVQWDYPGNPFRNNRALKLRAFVGAVVQMTMFLKSHEKNDRKAPPPIRTQLHGYHPVIWAAPYPGFKDVLPPEVQRAYEACLKLAGERILACPIRGDTCETDLLGPLGLVYISRAIHDAAFTRQVEAHIRPIFTEARFLHPAGYWDERGGIDTGFGGTANLYAAWIALMTDWRFAKEALDRVYRLRGHLILPEPDGTRTGPSHFNSRLGSPASKDQYDFGRDIAASMITDEAAWLIRTPTAEQLAKAPAARANQFNTHLRIAAKTHPDLYTEEDMKRISGTPWKLRVWMTYRFPVSVNPGYEFYRQGAFAHRQELEESHSPLLKSPFLRDENFVRAFEKDFVVTRQPGFAAIVHSGPVGVQTPSDKKIQYPGPMGLGGGQLSAFWTPTAGPVILGLRSGMSLEKSFERLDAWHTWPIHAISGVTADGKIFTSARIARPAVAADLTAGGGTVNVSGPLVAMKIARMYDDALEGIIVYTRTFKIDNKGVRVATTVTGDGKDTIAELYETIPVYLGAGQEQKINAAVRIEFQTGGQWDLATEQGSPGVKAIRVTRFGGAVLITFDTPRSVQLAPADWTDNWLNKFATCRNVMIDLLDGADIAVSSQGERVVRYEIAPAAEPAKQPAKEDK